MRTRQGCIQATGILLAACLFRVDALDEIPDKAEDWAEQGTVLTKGSGDAWDSSEREFKVLDCIKKDGVYYLYYAAGVTNCFVFCSHQCIGLATSTDGKSFTKHPDNPLICPEDMIEVNSWEEGVRHGTVLYNPDTERWVFYVGTDTDKWELAQPGEIPRNKWVCDVGVDGAIHVFTSNDGVAWNLEGVPNGVNNERGGENYACAVEYTNGTYYFWSSRAEGGSQQYFSSGTDYMNLTFHGKVEGLDFGWAHVKTYLHSDNNTLTYFYWPQRPGRQKPDEVFFATSSLNNPQEIADVRLVFANNEQTHEIIKDTEAGEWKWYYTPYWEGTVKLRTAPLEGMDTTPPSAPANLSAESDGTSRIDVSWDAAGDPESGIARYRIYRDGAKIGSSTETAYSDQNLEANTTYTYQVSAINNFDMEGAKSIEASATTDVDQTPPSIVEASAVGKATTVTVLFSEPLEKASAEQAANYTIDNGITVSGASLGSDNRTVSLTTSTLSRGTGYVLTVSNIKDRASTPNSIPAGTQASFEFLPYTSGTVVYDYYEGSFDALPDFNALTPVNEGTASDLAIEEVTQRADNFAIRFSGFIRIVQPGDYTFATVSDDGSALFIGETQVVDNDGAHGMEEKNGTIPLSAGMHPFVVTYFQGGAGKGLEVKWKPPASVTVPEKIPAEYLYAPSEDTEPVSDDPEPGTSITVLSPNGGERFGPGDTLHIRWTADVDLVDDVMIWLLLDGGMRRVLITSQFSVRRSDDNWGDYPWVVPPDAVKDTVSLVTDQATIRLHQYRDTDLQDYSDEFFAIGNGVSVGGAGRYAEMSNTGAISIRRSRNHVSVTGLTSVAGGTLQLVDVSGRVLGTAVVEGPAAAIEARSPVGPGMLLVRIRTSGGEMIEKCITH